MTTPPFAIGSFGIVPCEHATLNTQVNITTDGETIGELIQRAADFGFWQGALAGRQAAFLEAIRPAVN